MAKFSTHIENVKNHLNNGLSITSWEAIEMYHCTRLSAVIYSLKDRHDMSIVSEMISNEDGTRFARYHQVAKSGTKEEIKNYLMMKGEITSIIARDMFNCDHLKVVIRDLNNDGMKIIKTLEANEKGYLVNVYRLKK